MIETKITQRKLATLLGITYQHLNAVLRKRTSPSVSLAIKIEKMSRGQYRAVELKPELKQVKK